MNKNPKQAVVKISAVETSLFKLGENLERFILKHIPHIKENSILAITSKIVSLSEKAIISKSKIEKEALVRKQADVYLGKIAHNVHLTVKEGLLIPSSGIDESNAEGNFYILFPKNPFRSAERIWRNLKKSYKIKNLGIILTDSHTQPLRKGVTGIGLTHCGFRGVENLVGKKDLFGRKFKMTSINYVDGLSAAAVMMMGEGTTPCPLAVIENAPVLFRNKTSKKETSISIQNDLYAPLIKPLIKKKN